MNPIDLQSLLTDKGTACPACGRVHRAGLSRVIIEAGAMAKLPEVISSYGARKVFLLADPNTYAAAGEAVEQTLTAAGISSTVYLLTSQKAEPDEHAIGSVVMHFDKTCGLILGVGSGVINDLGKILANLTGLPYIIFGTAPSMDGYASATSSVIRDGLKYSLPSICPDTVIGDLDILCAAPMRMILAGLG
ncbi:MAG: iron-containing alcohol dehydrogenase, partial [Clostridia bacterium]|nr:iron-containing alcohol dehydrogenase [Clostridia bacterium]